jgi:hypothetical protein
MRTLQTDPVYEAAKLFLYKEQFRYLWRLLLDNNISDHEFRIETKFHTNTINVWERGDSQPNVMSARRIWEFFKKRGIQCDIKLLRFDVVTLRRLIRYVEDGQEKIINVNGRYILIYKEQNEVTIATQTSPVTH